MLKKTAIIVGGLIVLSVTGAFLYKFLNNETILNIDMNVIISMILAFFSIYLSMRFYFRAHETSNQFYLKSYDIMKEISILVGRLEERFGEKFNSLESRISEIPSVRNSVEKENKTIEGKITEKIENIEEILRQKNIDEEGIAKLKGEIAEKDKLINVQKNNMVVMNNKIMELIESDNTTPYSTAFKKFSRRSKNTPEFTEVRVLRSLRELNVELGIEEKDNKRIHDHIAEIMRMREDWHRNSDTIMLILRTYIDMINGKVPNDKIAYAKEKIIEIFEGYEGYQRI